MKAKLKYDNNRFWSFFVMLLTILFIGLKLANVGLVATWSWWWVLSPLWISISLIIAITLLAVVITGIIMFFKLKK